MCQVHRTSSAIRAASGQNLSHWSPTCRKPVWRNANWQPHPAERPQRSRSFARTFCGIPVQLCLVLAAGCFFIAIAIGQKSPQASTSRDISELAPEDLMKLKVTSAANKEQSLSKVGAALYVITREDIASSGANNIPDLLRLVPGVEVAQIDCQSVGHQYPRIQFVLLEQGSGVDRRTRPVPTIVFDGCCGISRIFPWKTSNASK